MNTKNSKKIHQNTKIESLIQKFYSAPNEKLKKMYRDMILRIDPKWKEIK